MSKNDLLNLDRKIKSVDKISFDEWVAIDAYENNRKVDRFKRKLHLRGDTSASQLMVASVEFTNDSGELVVRRIDGNSRTASWLNGGLSKPQFVWCVRYVVADEAERHALYSTIDNPKAAETAAETAYTANLELDYTPLSKLGKSSWTSALKVVAGSTDTMTATRRLLAELEAIDELDIDPTGNTCKGEARQVKGRFKLGVKIAMLKTITDKNALLFWKAYEREVETCEVMARAYELVDGSQAGGGAQGMLSGDLVHLISTFKPTKVKAKALPAVAIHKPARTIEAEPVKEETQLPIVETEPVKPKAKLSHLEQAKSRAEKAKAKREAIKAKKAQPVDADTKTLIESMKGAGNNIPSRKEQNQLATIAAAQNATK